MKAFLPLLFLSFLLAFTSCKKLFPTPKGTAAKDDLTQLPPETHEGKNSFGCLVNGQVWRNQGHGALATAFDNLIASYSVFTNNSIKYKTLTIDAAKKQDALHEIFSIQINQGFEGLGMYKLVSKSPDDGKSLAFFTHRNENSACYYRSDSVNTGVLEITRFDSINYIVSGRFNFNLAAAGCDTVRVTDGRFDIKYAY